MAMILPYMGGHATFLCTWFFLTKLTNFPTTSLSTSASTWLGDRDAAITFLSRETVAARLLSLGGINSRSRMSSSVSIGFVNPASSRSLACDSRNLTPTMSHLPHGKLYSDFARNPNESSHLATGGLI